MPGIVGRDSIDCLLQLYIVDRIASRIYVDVYVIIAIARHGDFMIWSLSIGNLASTAHTLPCRVSGSHVGHMAGRQQVAARAVTCRPHRPQHSSEAPARRATSTKQDNGAIP